MHGNETCETPECFQTLILLFMLPVFGANLLQALYGTVDLMVVGQFASTADVSAVSTFSAQNVGAGEYKRARSSMYLGMIWTFAVGLAVFLFSFSHGALLARLFSDDKDVIAAAADYLRSYAVDCVIVGINFSMMGYLNGNGTTFFVALQGILSTRGAQNRQRNVWQPLCKKSETSPFLWGRLFALFLCIFPRCCAIVIAK